MTLVGSYSPSGRVRRKERVGSRLLKIELVNIYFLTNVFAFCFTGLKKDVDPWSLIWYMASFGGLVTFFLVVSCSECCCSKRTSTNNNATNPRAAEPPPEVTQWVDETPPPPYHLFAPPSYDTLFYGTKDEKNKLEVYVVPIHNHMISLQTATSSGAVTPT